jgi:hypothetical protein
VFFNFNIFIFFVLILILNFFETGIDTLIIYILKICLILKVLYVIFVCKVMVFGPFQVF